MISENEVLEYLKDYKEQNHKMPTQQELAMRFNASTVTVKAVMQKLSLHGKLTLEYDTGGKLCNVEFRRDDNPKIGKFLDPFMDRHKLKHKVKLIVSQYYPQRRKVCFVKRRDSGDSEEIRETEKQLRAIDDAIKQVSSEYRDAVWEYCTNKHSSLVSITLDYPISERTLERYQTMFFYEVAMRLGFFGSKIH